ncbi:pyruvate oxidase (plasmid) [Nicoliella spurrieriana]|uniref:Pyruvate oxidase n=1 Tax=Nicoliella spurrieriana TaxID=2925830 RepID=A0A976X509_9LACO|nr:pyruvate oxidase [Nicoliella spurrieriana]UQS86057.1 pyruvate oxidase [Nicoliella spurrieriana]
MEKQKTIKASVALLKVLESWGVKDVYGYPGGSINSLLDGLQIEQKNINFIQVRHEQVAALTASAHAKLTGKIGVAFGSAGPGAVNLLNGLYDAREDHAPVLALVGQVPNTAMNYDYFQEMPETPMFSDVACYDRIVMTPESLPHVVDEAIKAAYKNKGVAVVVIPNNFGYEQIPEQKYTSATLSDTKPTPQPVATDSEIDKFLTLVKSAKRPVFHVGRGIKDGGEKIVELSKKLQIPIIIDGLACGLLPTDYDGFLGTANRAASKAADEILSVSDLVIAVGGDFAFAHTYYASHPFKYVQVDNDQSMLGRHHTLDLGIWSDATKFVEKALERSTQVAETNFFKAAVADMQNWKEYLKHMKESSATPLLPGQVYNAINETADPDASFSIDVGDNIINTFRYLDLSKQNKWVISALFATMGSGIPGAIAAKRAYPDKQAWNIAGDGALAMVLQDLATIVKYKIPVINVVTSNNNLSFIQGEQEDAPMQIFGLDLQPIDFAKVANGFGIDAVTVTKANELKPAFEKATAAAKDGKPFLVEVKIGDQRGLPVEDLQLSIINGKLDESVSPNYLDDKPADVHYTPKELFKRYNGENLKTLPEFFDEYNVEL